MRRSLEVSQSLDVINADFLFTTLFRMFSPSLSPLTTVKSSPDHETRPSSCGTLWLSASTPSKKMDTAIGFRAFVSHQTRSIQSSSRVRNFFKLFLFSIFNFEYSSSAGWDRTVKVWNLTNCKLKLNHYGHNGYLNTVTVSPDGSLCTSGGKDCKALLWDLNDGKHLHTLDHNDIINALCFSPNRYWLCVAYGSSIKIWDLACKKMVEELRPGVSSNDSSKAEPPQCLSLAWSTDGQTLFAGYSDNKIRVWQVSVSAR